VDLSPSFVAVAQLLAQRTGLIALVSHQIGDLLALPFEISLSVPKELDGTGGDGTNSEQLFAAWDAACYESALRLVARMTASIPDSDRNRDLGRRQVGR
jgi:hypothetical protein